MSTQPKKFQLSSYVSPEVYTRIKSMADAEGLSVSRISLEAMLLGLPTREEMSERRKQELGF